MKKEKRVLTICVVALLTIFISSNALATLAQDLAAQNFSELVVFGDSLASNGNLDTQIPGMYPPNPPYWNGRASNGRVWTEYLSDHLGLAGNTRNFAASGATSFDILNMQIPQYIPGSPDNTNTLYVLQSGNNDFLYADPQDPLYVDPQDPLGWPQLALHNINQSISELYAIGARNFVVANAPNYGIIPRVQNTGDSAGATGLAQAFNDALAAKLHEFENQTGANVYIADFFEISTQVAANPGLFGFTNATDPWLPAQIGNANDYVFYDDVHPTTAMHALIVPEPATMLMLLTGSCFLLRRKQ